MFEELTRLIASKPELLKNTNANIPRMVKLVQYLIDNGVTIPVRCKDCKHWQPIHEHIPHMECNIFCGAYEHGYPTSADDFCSYGENKDNV